MIIIPYHAPNSPPSAPYFLLGDDLHAAIQAAADCRPVSNSHYWQYLKTFGTLEGEKGLTVPQTRERLVQLAVSCAAPSRLLVCVRPLDLS